MIYGGIVVLWLCYLVPLALRRYDEASRARSVERFSNAMRVLGRAETAANRARPARTRARPVGDRAVRAAARKAARRRRRVLVVLLALTALVAGACGLALLPWWGLAVPGLLVVGFLVLARVQVARARSRSWEHGLAAALRAEQASTPPASTEAADADPDDVPTVVLDPVAVEGPVGSSGVVVADQTVVGEQTVVAAAVVTTDGGSLWDPLPVTLPTYVSKPRATRSVRTIDLGGPGAWTSGRLTAEEAQQVREAGADAGVPAPPAAATEHARAVGD